MQTTAPKGRYCSRDCFGAARISSPKIMAVLYMAEGGGGLLLRRSRRAYVVTRLGDVASFDQMRIGTKPLNKALRHGLLRHERPDAKAERVFLTPKGRALLPLLEQR